MTEQSLEAQSQRTAGNTAEEGPEVASTTASQAAPAEPATSGAKPRPGVPVWRVGKPDSVLAAAVDQARNAVLEIAKSDAVGAHVAVKSEGIRCVTHLFECNLAGYVGWQWFATITRLSRSKEVTINEIGLLPTERSVLAPPWVPWAERVRPEDSEPAVVEETSESNKAPSPDENDDASAEPATPAEDAEASADAADAADSDLADSDEAADSDVADPDDSGVADSDADTADEQSDS